IDRDPGRDLDEQRGFLLERHEPGTHGLQKSGQLRLQRIEDGERPKLHPSDAITARSPQASSDRRYDGDDGGDGGVSPRAPIITQARSLVSPTLLYTRPEATSLALIASARIVTRSPPAAAFCRTHIARTRCLAFAIGSLGIAALPRSRSQVTR